MMRNITFLKYLFIVSFAIIRMSNPSTAQDTDAGFKTWENVLNADCSEYFAGDISGIYLKDDYINNHPWLSEESLFVQSNTRILVCQDPKGELRYAAMPLQVYPLPTGHGIPNGPGYGPGMYYHFDAVRLVHLNYSFQAEGSASPMPLVNRDEFNKTYYAGHFLPVTRGRTDGLESTIISFAPVSANPEKAAFSPAPLPGPPGAWYVLLLKNTGTEPVKGSVLLSCEKKLHNQETQKNIDRNTLILTIPEASAGIHLVGGRWTENEDCFISAKEIELRPGASVIVESIIVLGETYRDIMPAVYQFYLRESLDWLNLTASFWNDRLGKLTIGSDDFPEITRISRDIYYRCVIDNFCCLQTGQDGHLLAHYQGVPKEGTIWGIDYEPTIISAMHVAPELGRAGIWFTMERNRPPRTESGLDHSVPILISPVMIARKYLELTGDLDFFKDNPDVMVSLDRTMQDLLSLKAPGYTLFPTRYSSDGPVGRRYDHGTNVKVFYALEGYGYILDAIGTPEQARHYHTLARELSAALDQTMVIQGPFGPQYSGGTNLGEDPGDFYLDDSVPYYDGEDTGSHLGPVYGVYGWAHQPWINYHRWARSLLCPWYEPEFGTMRWFPSWSMPVLDGTGWISTLGGCATRWEMAVNMQQLYRICDPSASLYWWPFGYNFRQGLSRCSQGQGTWAWQYLEQWLGIHIDALSHTMIIAPRGLPTSILWKHMQAGNHFFDIRWEEDDTGSYLEITNYNKDPWTIRFGAKPPGTGITENLDWKQFRLDPGVTNTVTIRPGNKPEDFLTGEDRIAQVEINKLGDKKGIVFVRYGTVDPFPAWYHLWKEEALDLRFYIINGSGSDWREVSVTLNYPDGWLARPREPGQWERPGNMIAGRAIISLSDIPAGQNTVAPFIFSGPYDFDHDYLTQGLSKHYPAEQGPDLRLPTKDVDHQIDTQFKAVLNAVSAADGKIVKELIIPVIVIPVKK